MIFDMDGVLCDSEEFICAAAREMFRRRYDTDVAPEDFLPFVGAGENRYLGGPAEKHGIAIHLPEDKEYTYEIYLEIIRGRLKLLPGVSTFISSARAKGLKLAVASAADRMKVEGNLAEFSETNLVERQWVTASKALYRKVDGRLLRVSNSDEGINRNLQEILSCPFQRPTLR